MTPISQKVDTIHQLMRQLQSELVQVPAYQQELNASLKNKDEEELDILHLLENLTLNQDELSDVSHALHVVRRERREIKESLASLRALHQPYNALIAPLKTALKLHDAQQKSQPKEMVYRFRTDAGYQLYARISGQTPERSMVPMLSRDAPSIAMGSRKTYETPEKYFVADKPAKLLLNHGTWHLYCEANCVLLEKDLFRLVEKFYNLGGTHIETNHQSKDKLLLTLERLMASEPKPQIGYLAV